MNASPEFPPADHPGSLDPGWRASPTSASGITRFGPPPPQQPGPQSASPEIPPPERPGPPSDEANPYWTPPGLDLTGWSAAQRAEVAAIVNPIYRELVLSTRSALAKPTGLTIVHLLWLEILDQMELASAKSECDILELTISEIQNRSRRQIIDRHLRTVHAKLKASDLLLRLKDLRRKSRSRGGRNPDDNIPDNHAAPFSPYAPRRPKHGKNDFC